MFLIEFFFLLFSWFRWFFLICWSSNWLVPTWWKIDLAKTTPLFQDYYYFHLSFILICFWSFYHSSIARKLNLSFLNNYQDLMTEKLSNSSLDFKKHSLPLYYHVNLFSYHPCHYLNQKNQNAIKSNLTIRNGPFS